MPPWEHPHPTHIQVVEAIAEGRSDPEQGRQPLRDVRLGHVVTAVRLVEGGGVEVEVEGQVRSFCLLCAVPHTLVLGWHPGEDTSCNCLAEGRVCKCSLHAC